MKLTVGDYKKLEERLNAVESKYNKSQEVIKSYQEKEKEAVEKAKEDENKALLMDGQNEKSFNSRPVGNSYQADEMKCFSAFGVKDISGLIEVNTNDEKFRRVSNELKHLVVSLKKEMQNARMIAQIFYGDPLDKVGATEQQDKFPMCKNILNSYYAKNVLIPRLKAFGTTVSGGGAEYIMTAIANTYIAEVELEKELVGMFKQIDMPTSPFELPTAGGFTKARRIAENTSATASSFTTGAISLQASKFVEYFEIPEELNEDSIVGILDLGRIELTNAHLRAFESCVINGTKIGTAHIDSDTQAGGTDLAEKQFHGLRYYGIGNTANGGTYDYLNGAITDAKLRAHRKNLGKFGVNPLDLIWVVGPSAYLQMLGTDNVVTVDKLGAMATVLRGQLGTYAGSPIVQSGFMREDLNATGVFDNTTKNRTGILLVHKDRWYWGTRRPIRMALREALSKDDRYEIASYSRVDFKGHTQSASEKGVCYGYNIPS